MREQLHVLSPESYLLILPTGQLTPITTANTTMQKAGQGGISVQLAQRDMSFHRQQPTTSDAMNGLHLSEAPDL